MNPDLTTAQTAAAAPTAALSERQKARIECLEAARRVIVARSPLTSASANPDHLIRVASWIETGTDSPASP